MMMTIDRVMTHDDDSPAAKTDRWMGYEQPQ
jgi:hypothetical protein